MKKTGFLYDERYLLHDTGPGHPESPERLKAIYQGIKEADLLSKLIIIQASRADLKWIETVGQSGGLKMDRNRPCKTLHRTLSSRLQRGRFDA